MFKDKKEKLDKIIQPDGKTVIIPMDHGVSCGPIKGIESPKTAVKKITNGGADAIIGHLGFYIRGYLSNNIQNEEPFVMPSYIMHLSASSDLSPKKNYKVLVNSVETAAELGAGGVSVHVNIGADNEPEMLIDMGKVAQECLKYGMPLLAMMYPRGHEIDNPKDVKYAKIAARIGAELGADIIKTVYTGSPETFKEVVDGCPVPVVIAGGAKGDDLKCLEMIEGAIKAGGAGVSIGRSAFSHSDPIKMTQAVRAVVHERKTAEEAIELLR
jgi:fructose-bisphosphate aldolase/2-amino-3,7-dideoxy-D-threo-hept-6-ulosonate synthase